ncbi:regulator of sigma E protease [Chryseolinea serpens]|uniref:Regulator of sigma E protease n=1 Tax=Chryseolinea serpens TaxID=947013 RepID=A0A1M5XCV8_9BACT|nr:PDZ domain-containing protein [Chryseolinea serpens]SHH97043.1 regulator of sigma E protease [Chryseolinea serpens]
MFYGLLSVALLNVIYVIGFFFFSILLNVRETHYFLGFGPKLITFQVRGVRFSMGVYIPIIGFAKIYVMENGEKQRMKYPWEFYDQSLARRLGATLGGALTLLITGVLVFIGWAYVEPKSVITKEEVNRYGIYPSDWATELGFRRGDKIISINGNDYDEYSDLIDPSLFQDPKSYYTVLRNGETLQINVRKTPDDFQESKPFFLTVNAPFEIAEVVPNSSAATAGILVGDRITKVNGHPILKFHDFTDECKIDEDGDIKLEIKRKGADSLRTLNVNLVLGPDKRIGTRPTELINYTTERNSLLTAVGYGTYAAFNGLAKSISAVFRLAIHDRLPREMKGPIKIASVFETSFWAVTASYATWYAFCNLLPLPFSAFWEIVALVFGWITKKKYPYKAFSRSRKVAWFILGAFFISILVMDVLQKFETLDRMRVH